MAPQDVAPTPCIKHYILRTRTTVLQLSELYYTTADKDLASDSMAFKVRSCKF